MQILTRNPMPTPATAHQGAAEQMIERRRIEVSATCWVLEEWPGDPGGNSRRSDQKHRSFSFLVGQTSSLIDRHDAYRRWIRLDCRIREAAGPFVTAAFFWKKGLPVTRLRWRSRLLFEVLGDIHGGNSDSSEIGVGNVETIDPTKLST